MAGSPKVRSRRRQSALTFRFRYPSGESILARTARPRLQASFHLARWENSFFDFRFPRSEVVPPKPWPITGVKRICARIPGYNRADIRPVSRLFDQPTLQRIEQDIIRTGKTEHPPLPFRSCQDMVVSLMLEFRRLEKRTDLGTEKLYTIALVGVTAQPHPDMMNMVGHQAVSRANQSFTHRRVKHHLAKRSVKMFGQPALLAMGNRHGPKDDGIGLIKLAFQPWQIVGEIRTGFPSGNVGSVEIFKAHGEMLARTDVRGYPIFVAADVQSAHTSQFGKFLRELFQRRLTSAATNSQSPGRRRG